MPAGLDHDGQMSTTHTGRPRLRPQRRPGITGRDEILDAASELFTTLGYAGTSTRSIADSVGIRQASLYHYFKTKDDILCAVLSQTVAPTLAFIPSLLNATPPLSATEHLHALAAFDGDQLLGGTWNLGALYLLPELRADRLEPFWSDRERLRQHYLTLSREVLHGPASIRRRPTYRSGWSNRWSTCGRYRTAPSDPTCPCRSPMPACACWASPTPRHRHCAEGPGRSSNSTRAPITS